jgi:hypothetical protein
MKEVKKRIVREKKNHFYVKTEKFEKKGKNQEQERRGKRS